MNRDKVDTDNRDSGPDFERDENLDALFARAREYRPAPAQVIHLLRAIRGGGGRAGRRVWRLGGALAAAAAGITVGIILLAPPSQPRALALSRVVEAMRAVPVVQLTSSYGRTTWIGTNRFYAAHDSRRAEYEYRDFTLGTVATYDDGRGCIILSTVDGPPIPYAFGGPMTLDELIENAGLWGQSFAEAWERIDRAENGQPIIELRAKKTDQGGYYIKIDGISGRILREEWTGNYTDYAYPEQPPRDLYDIGVPRDVRVVDGRAPAAVLALRDTVVARVARGFGAYRLVAVDSVGGMGVHRLITDGQRYRLDIMPFDDTREHTVEDLQAIARRYDHMESLATQTTEILGAETEHSVLFGTDGAVRSRRVTPRRFSSMPLHTLEGATYRSGGGTGFFSTWPDQQIDALGPNKKGWVGYRIRRQANNCVRPCLGDSWYDPQHGYAPCFSEGYDDPQADWQLKAGWQEVYSRDGLNSECPADAPARRSESEVLEWAELRPGQWYPAVKRIRFLERAPGGTWQPRQSTRVQNFHPVTYRVLAATPLDAVDDAWFEVPAEWLAVPAKPFP